MKRKQMPKRIVLAGVAVAVATSGMVAFHTLFRQTAYTVTRVIDGDTFVTAENQIIRINGIQAPEKGLCGSDDSANTLEKLVVGKKVYIKIVYLDRYRRQIANVYLSNGQSLGELLAAKGSVIVVQGGKSDKHLLGAGNKARSTGIGLYGEPCTQRTNKKMPSCTIKANKNLGTTNNIYHTPACKAYATVLIQLYLGDQWFCTEKEAISAGFTKAKTCP